MIPTRPNFRTSSRTYLFRRDLLGSSIPPAEHAGIRRDSPSGIAYYERRPAHKRLVATAFDGVRREYEATAYPLLGGNGEMHGVVAVFWEGAPGEYGH